VEITEVRIKLIQEAGDRLQAFCSITFDNSFVVRDLKIIEGASGPFVAMPSRKLTSRCPQCACKNHLKAAYCNQCGLRLNESRLMKDDSGRAKLYADIAHPINAACREMIQDRVVQEFRAEVDRAQQPGYVSRYDDYDLEEEFAEPREIGEGAPREAAQRTHTKVQPAEGPRGPHKPRTHATGDRRPRGNNNFGAGIL
jgi:stage V sporulation protein G